MRRVSLLLLLVACGSVQRPRPTDGAIAGLVRDRTSGDPLGNVTLELSSGAATKSTNDGLYTIDHVRPGHYTLVARYTDESVTVENISVDAGEATYVDVDFALDAPAPVVVDFATARQDAITRYQSPHGVTSIEGTVSELTTRERVGGAVVTAVGGPRDETLQTVTDETGRYQFGAVEPGTYVVSAYYNVGGRGQIEVRRSGIAVERAQRVRVPLFVELKR